MCFSGVHTWRSASSEPNGDEIIYRYLARLANFK